MVQASRTLAKGTRLKGRTVTQAAALLLLAAVACRRGGGGGPVCPQPGPVGLTVWNDDSDLVIEVHGADADDEVVRAVLVPEGGDPVTIEFDGAIAVALTDLGLVEGSSFTIEASSGTTALPTVQGAIGDGGGGGTSNSCP